MTVFNFHMKKFFNNLEKILNHSRDAGLLFIRLLLAYGFYGPAKEKWSDIHAFGNWLGELGLPLPQAQAYLAASTEAIGIVLLTLGLLSRIIAFPLIGTMLVAIFTVHLSNGFSASDNGFEIPLYYLAMLVVLIGQGSGRYSLDYLFFRNSSEIKSN